MSVNITTAIESQFSNIIFYKVTFTPQYSVYAARIYTLLIGNRYLFLIVDNKYAVKETMRIGEVPWLSFQTRTTNDEYNIPLQYYPSNDSTTRDISITAIFRDHARTTYINNLYPYEIMLLHQNKSMYQYADNIKLSAALATFQCIVSRM